MGFPYYFLYLCHPDKNLYVKPKYTKKYLEFFGKRKNYSATPSRETYELILGIAEELKTALSVYQPRDMVDIQSLLWVIAGVFENLDVNKEKNDYKLSKPFSEMFKNYDQAEMAFDLLALVVNKFHNNNTKEELLSITLTPFENGYKLRVNFGNWLVLCREQTYNRLNQDYQPLHVLCRFFLENSGPSYETGDNNMLPFMVNMARLFELFVAEWLIAHLPKKYQLEKQESVKFGLSGDISFLIDLVISETKKRENLCVYWTRNIKPLISLLKMILLKLILYSGLKNCIEGILVYPELLKYPMDSTVKGVRIRSATFSLDGDLEAAGQRFLKQILPDGDMIFMIYLFNWPFISFPLLY